MNRLSVAEPRTLVLCLLLAACATAGFDNSASAEDYHPIGVFSLFPDPGDTPVRVTVNVQGAAAGTYVQHPTSGQDILVVNGQADLGCADYSGVDSQDIMATDGTSATSSMSSCPPK